MFLIGSKVLEVGLVIEITIDLSISFVRAALSVGGTFLKVKLATFR